MATAKIRVWLDEELQLVRQRVEGDMDGEDFSELMRRTDESAKRLRDPGFIRILVDGRRLGKPSPEVRRLALCTMDLPTLGKMAVWGTNAFARTMFAFLTLVTRRTNVKTFRTEREARSWLLE